MSKIANHLRTLAIAVLILLTGSAFAAKEAPELQQLRDQLKKAQDAEDKPAIIELSERIVAIAPNDSGTWDTLAQTNSTVRNSIAWSDARCVAKSIQETARCDRRFPRRIVLQAEGLSVCREALACVYRDQTAASRCRDHLRQSRGNMR